MDNTDFILEVKQVSVEFINYLKKNSVEKSLNLSADTQEVLSDAIKLIEEFDINNVTVIANSFLLLLCSPIDESRLRIGFQRDLSVGRWTISIGTLGTYYKSDIGGYSIDPSKKYILTFCFSTKKLTPKDFIDLSVNDSAISGIYPTSTIGRQCISYVGNGTVNGKQSFDFSFDKNKYFELYTADGLQKIDLQVYREKFEGKPVSKFYIVLLDKIVINDKEYYLYSGAE